MSMDIKTKEEVEQYVYDLDKKKEAGYKKRIFDILEYAHANDIISIDDYSEIICNIHY